MFGQNQQGQQHEQQQQQQKTTTTIYQLLPTIFWQILKARFLDQHQQQQQQHISYQWPDFDETLKLGLWDQQW